MLLLISIATAAGLACMDNSDQPKQNYIWIHYAKDGHTVLGSGMISAIDDAQQDLNCAQRTFR